MSMDVKEAGRLGGLARTANMTPEQRTESSLKALAVRWGGSAMKAKRAKARKLAKIAAASRKANR